ncbi:TIGR03905 family TSCPD domain-containing protein [bacterium]|nr:TIGR03905 family TSCPD domain-containing protein [bacterium]MDY3861763.1 TIGR03905 family TSCPD domain-containing protein [Ruminococcus sp.]
MKYDYTPRGVCSRRMTVEIENGIIKDCRILGGCNGNSQGICSLVIGMDAREAIKRLKGIDCNGRGTSCPDQLAYALEEALSSK